MTTRDRFEEKFIVRPGTRCRHWTASRNLGYGVIGSGGHRHEPLFAHRVSYELYRGPIPKDLVIDHMCRNRACVNPDHLRLLTRGQNVMCGEGIAARKARATHCPNGHEYTKENVYMHDSHRIFRTCRRSNDEKRRASRKNKTHTPKTASMFWDGLKREQEKQ